MRILVDRILEGFTTRRFLIAFATALIGSVVVACGSMSSDSVDTAPEFTLPVANRIPNITLSDFRGDQNVVLVFYRGFF